LQKGAARDTNLPRTREEALELYSRLVKPLPQRQYDTQRRFQSRLAKRRGSKGHLHSPAPSDCKMDCDDNYFSEIAPQSLQQKATISGSKSSQDSNSSASVLSAQANRKRSPQVQSHMDTSDTDMDSSADHSSKRAKVPILWP